MKIALITDGIYPYVMGGMQKHSYFLAKYFSLNNIKVDLYHYVPASKMVLPNPFTEEELKNINLIEIDYPESRKFPGHYLYERYLYSKEILSVFKTRSKPDFIYAKGFSAWALLRYKKKLNIETPVGVNFHGYEMFQRWPDFKTGIKLQILKLPVLYTMRKADFLFSYGGKISEIIKSKGFQDKIIEIPTGISSSWLVEHNRTKSSDTVKFVFVGRSERRKGIQEINSVLKTLNSSNFEFHFIGPIDEDMRLNIKNVYYHGPVYNEDEIKDLLDKMDVLVCPSYSEGMPNVIMEGMARGLAIIATDVGAVSLMVGESNGILLSGDIISGLNKALISFTSMDSNELFLKQQHSIEKVKNNFTWEKVIQKTIHLVSVIK
ncbi:glycosyltransferase family 4 protein [Algibacter sp.]|nr:glycosyltransferase family 4 protein [Algibacter sp.]MDB4274067.1 glycosyltransferase family 4 protein [Algibacter sp.]